MNEVPAQSFLNFFLYLLIPFLGGFLAKKLRLQSLFGYILAGVIIGNLFSGLIPKESINFFANIGIILLLFMVGLEINFEKLIIFKKFIVIGGILQVLLSIFFILIVSPVFGFNFIQSLLIGIALSSSSTVLVTKIVQEKGEESSFISEMATGILIFQDIAFIPFIIIFNSLNGGHLSTYVVVKEIFVSSLQSIIILSIMYYFGRRVVPHIFDRVAKTSRELLNIFIVLFISLVCYLSQLVGVPILLSAFIAGILVSQTTEHYHIFSQLRPIRDLMVVIFFVFIGTHIDITRALPMAPTIFTFTFIVLLIKFLVILSIFFYFKLNSRITFFIATMLFQIDEDAFILFSIAYAHSLFTFDQYIVLVSATLISLMLSPIAIGNKEKVYFAVRAFCKKYFPSIELFIRHRLDSDPTSIDVLQIKNHVIICGYGRLGSHIGKALMHANIPFVAIDYNFSATQKAKREGINAIYGDSTDGDILDYAEIEHAVALVSVVPDKFSQEAIILTAKKLNPKITVISRVHTHIHQQRMIDLGADVVVEPELEASLAIIKRLFHLKGLSPDDRIKHLRHFRLEQGMG